MNEAQVIHTICEMLLCASFCVGVDAFIRWYGNRR